MGLIDAIVGSALMLVVFVGIAAAFQLSVAVVTSNKSRAGAIALANERMEYLKSLSYAQVGVIGGIPAGNVEQLESASFNGTAYTRRTMVFYSDDPGDGLGEADENDIIADFKTIRVEVSWSHKTVERSVTLVGRVSPPGLETSVGGGILTINVVDANSAPLSNAQVDIANTDTSPAINIRTYTNVDGSVSFIGAPAASDYQIIVSKSGYSSAQTYAATAENPNPDPRHLTVSDSQTTTATFAIDLVSTKTVETYMHIVERDWTDSFADDALIALSASTTRASGEVLLAGPPYEASGYIESVSIAPSLLAGWNEFSWSESTPANTDVLYRVYNTTGGVTTIVPDAHLPGNGAGFSSSPVDLSGLSTSTYQSLRVYAELTSQDPDQTPRIEWWNVSYDYGPEPLPNAPFTMRGNKTIGNSPTVYKYNQSHQSGAESSVTVTGVEWDTYRLGVSATSTYDIAEACAPQPEALAPGSAQATRLYFLPATAHSLLIDVRSQAGTLLEGATIQATSTGYDLTKESSACGQAYFGGLTSGSFWVNVSKSGYQDAATSVTVNGDVQLSVTLQAQ